MLGSVPGTYMVDGEYLLILLYPTQTPAKGGGKEALHSLPVALSSDFGASGYNNIVPSLSKSAFRTHSV